ncbi:hypothetical protein WH47_05289 [Habropoda laboriosa]|uniref:Uncharacterized protein n=1 Tax=Habropoda laboriosa TaxID=597456 RepID=A0A0L7QVI6_9HYME|nr:PREDICTED: uncharacterized protein LOC108574806 [Habropoda laboriosa]KOC62647.1 hypothetical protein WH47_05289 [Habropoda laboriosa]
MNHIMQTWNTKLSNQQKSPSCRRILSSDNLASPVIADCGTWRTRMLAKVKECRDAIKNMMAFDKIPNNVETARGLDNSNIPPRATASMSSIPDIITFSSIALKHKDYDYEPLLTDNLNSDDVEKMNASDERLDDMKNTNNNDSFDRFVFGDRTTSSSLQSFLTLEKKINDEYFEEENTYTIKKKISAEPFLSYTDGVTEFVWTDDTMEESFPGKASNSLDHLNSSDIGFENPRINSTFCENSHVKQNRTSSPIRRCLFQDSGYENNFSI